MATTDALSVACKQLGIAADVYWNAGESKYNNPYLEPVKPADKASKPQPTIEDRIKKLCDYHKISRKTFDLLLVDLQASAKVADKAIADMNADESGAMISQMHTMILETKKE